MSDGKIEVEPFLVQESVTTEEPTSEKPAPELAISPVPVRTEMPAAIDPVLLEMPLGSHLALTSNTFERDFDKNPTPLFALIQQRNWPEAIFRCQNHHEEAKCWVSRREENGNLRWRLLPIHAAIVFNAPEIMVETLLAAYPMGVKCKDDQGMLPLHSAFKNHCSAAVVNQLLIAYPKSIDIPDHKGRLPSVLVQASSAPHKQAVLNALQKGPAFYEAAAANTERVVVQAQQKAIFDLRMQEMAREHQRQMEALKIESEQKQIALQERLAQMQDDLEKTQESSQVLVDHVSLLESQLDCRASNEKFMAAKLASMDSTMKEMSANPRQEQETALKAENYALILERDELKAKVQELEKKQVGTQQELLASFESFEAKEKQWAKKEKELTDIAKKRESDWANAQASCAIMESRLKKKTDTDHGWASQVSSLAAKLAESSVETRETAIKHSKRIKEFENERSTLRMSVKHLTQRLNAVVKVLETMTVQQARIVQDAKMHENAAVQALSGYAKLVAAAKEQEKIVEATRQEREAMKNAILEQEDQARKIEQKRSQLLSSTSAGEMQIAQANAARSQMIQDVHALEAETNTLLGDIRTGIPQNIEAEDDFLDAVIENIATASTPVVVKATGSTIGSAVAAPAVDEQSAPAVLVPVQATESAADSTTVPFVDEQQPAPVVLLPPVLEEEEEEKKEEHCESDAPRTEVEAKTTTESEPTQQKIPGTPADATADLVLSRGNGTSGTQRGIDPLTTELEPTQLEILNAPSDATVELVLSGSHEKSVRIDQDNLVLSMSEKSVAAVASVDTASTAKSSRDEEGVTGAEKMNRSDRIMLARGDML